MCPKLGKKRPAQNRKAFMGKLNPWLCNLKTVHVFFFFHLTFSYYKRDKYTQHTHTCTATTEQTLEKQDKAAEDKTVGAFAAGPGI